MICLWFLRRGSFSCTGHGFMAVVQMPAVYLFGRRAVLLVLLFLTLGARSFDLPVTAVKTLSKPSLSFCGFLCVKISRKTVCAEMLFWYLFAMVVALDVLPGIAFRTIDGIAIIICVDTDAFDGVFLLLLKVVV